MNAPNAGDIDGATVIVDDGEYRYLVAATPVLDLDTLTAVEAEVASKIVLGWTNARIAAAQGTSPRTIANQLRAIYRKMGVSNRYELVACMIFRDRL